MQTASGKPVTTPSDEQIARLERLEQRAEGITEPGAKRLIVKQARRLADSIRRDRDLVDRYHATGLDVEKALRCDLTPDFKRMFVTPPEGERALQWLLDHGWLIGTQIGPKMLYSVHIGST